MNYFELVNRYETGIILSFVTLLAILAVDGSVAFAANLDTNIIDGSSSFNNVLSEWVISMRFAVQIISTIMVALGGLMVATGQESGMKTVWNIMLGAGLALNIGSALTGLYTPESNTTVSQDDFKITVDNKGIDSILAFPTTYQHYTENGAKAMVGPATKLLLVFTAINASVKLSLDLISGDKIRYLTELLLETGAYFMLIIYWYGDSSKLNIMGSLCEGFEQLGYQAGGIGSGVVANNILGNMYEIIITFFKTVNFPSFSPLLGISSLILLLIMFVLLALTGLELFMARIEFWTLAMVTIPLIPFAALPQTKFLFESALKCMLNCAIKVCVIAFLTAMTSNILLDYVKAFNKASETNNILGNFPLCIQAVLVSLLLYLIVKKIPELVTSLLSGNPNLGGGTSMKTMGTKAANTAVQAGAAGVNAAIGIGKGAAMGAASAAGGRTGFKVAGAALMGGLNGAAGAAMSGVVGMSKAAIGVGKDAAGGGLLGGMVQSARTGAKLGRNFGGGDTATDHVKNVSDSIFRTLGSHDKITPSYAPKTGQAIYEKDKQGNIIMDKDGNPKQKQVVSARHGGILGSIKDITTDISSAYKAIGNNRKH